MRTLVIGLAGIPFVTALVISACGGTAGTGFKNDGGGGGSSGSGGSAGTGGLGGLGGSGGSAGSGGTSGIGLGDGGGGKDSAGDVIITTKTIIYANTDTELYTIDPSVSPPNPVLVGTFAGMSGSTYDSTITDVAVDAEGDVYVNTETVVYKAAVPTSPGTVNLTKVTTITPPAGASYVSFYALAFAPKGFLGTGEELVGGDSAGEVWAIDTTGSTIGTVHDLGNFGKVPGKTDGSIFGLSGDIVFYTDTMGNPTGLATIRECAAGGKSCTATNDYLAGIDMKALAGAFTGTPASSLLGGIYGGSSTSIGSGTGYGRLFGLGAWEGTVYGFERLESSAPTNPPNIVSINTTSGAGSVVSAPSITSGWSGAGVSTTVTITVPAPPPPPPQPK